MYAASLWRIHSHTDDASVQKGELRMWEIHFTPEPQFQSIQLIIAFFIKRKTEKGDVSHQEEATPVCCCWNSFSLLMV